MTTVRDALDTYPLAHLLQPGFGRMDLRPSLALHLARELDAPPLPPADPAIGELVDELLELRGQWCTLASQLPGTERSVILQECANALSQVLGADG